MVPLSRPGDHFQSEEGVTFVREEGGHFPSEFPFDNNGGLQSVLFSSPWQSDLYYNTEIISRVRDFTSVIYQAYGMATKSYGIPSVSDFYSTTYKKVRIWDVGTKSIEIGVQKKTTAREFYVEVIISDHSQSEQRNKQALQDRLDNIESSSELF